MITIAARPLSTEDVIHCAQMMSQSDPWLTLGRDYDASYKTICDPSKEIYLATIEETIAGFIIINMTGVFTGYIQSVCVDAEWRGQGIGTQMIKYAEELIFQSVPNVFICVSSFNKDALRLYKRLGYSVIGELEDYIISGASEILLRKTVAPLMLFSP
ncbi:MAG: GNAT family N-acetyltransferase [Symploca sp. SIO2G7]|nr:GNAT family N-acetyltransferase [Symploca sp. SIO2G7]